MSDTKEISFVDASAVHGLPNPLAPIVIKKEVIDCEVRRLLDLPNPPGGRRMSFVSNPSSGLGNGLTQGISVAICVLKPGERTVPLRHNSSLVNFCIQGSGSTVVGERRFDYRQSTPGPPRRGRSTNISTTPMIFTFD